MVPILLDQFGSAITIEINDKRSNHVADVHNILLLCDNYVIKHVETTIMNQTSNSTKYVLLVLTSSTINKLHSLNLKK